MDDIDNGSNLNSGELDKSDSGKHRMDELSPKDEAFKALVLHKLVEIRDKEIQPQLYDKDRPERTPHIQRANFIYALISLVKEDFKVPNDAMRFVLQLEVKYPMAVVTIDEVKAMLKSLHVQ